MLGRLCLSFPTNPVGAPQDPLWNASRDVVLTDPSDVNRGGGDGVDADDAIEGKDDIDEVEREEEEEEEEAAEDAEVRIWGK